MRGEPGGHSSTSAAAGLRASRLPAPRPSAGPRAARRAAGFAERPAWVAAAGAGSGGAPAAGGQEASTASAPACRDWRSRPRQPLLTPSCSSSCSRAGAVGAPAAGSLGAAAVPEPQAGCRSPTAAAAAGAGAADAAATPAWPHPRHALGSQQAAALLVGLLGICMKGARHPGQWKDGGPAALPGRPPAALGGRASAERTIASWRPAGDLRTQAGVSLTVTARCTPALPRQRWRPWQAAMASMSCRPTKPRPTCAAEAARADGAPAGGRSPRAP